MINRACLLELNGAFHALLALFHFVIVLLLTVRGAHRSVFVALNKFLLLPSLLFLYSGHYACMST